MVCTVVSVLGEDACNESESLGGNVCAPISDEAHRSVNDPTSGASGDAVGSEHPIWWNYSADQLFDYFECAEIIYGYGYGEDYSEDDSEDDSGDDDYVHEENTEVDDVVSEAQLHKIHQQWSDIREKYIKEVNLVPIVHEEIIDTGSEEGESEKELNIRQTSRGVSAIVVPTRIGDAGPKKGRGLFATEPMRKGTLVSNKDNGSTGIFKVGHSWREFAVSLPRETACKFIEWSWVQTVPPLDEMDDDIRNGLTIFFASDESSLMNGADWDEVEANVRCGSPPKHDGDEWGPCRFHYYAVRDIAVGEELLINYGDFEDVDLWTEFGL